MLASTDNRVLGVRVERARAEELRRELAMFHLVDKTVSILDDGDFVEIPVIREPVEGLLARYGAAVVDMAFPARQFMKDPIEIISEQAEIPDPLKQLLPPKWEQFGDVVVLRLDHALDRYDAQVARAYAGVLKARTVLRDLGGIGGEFREPMVKPIFGSDAVTTHIENGIKFRFDVSRIMFSSGNQEERTRMSSIRCDGETVIDMFAGIGYFSIPIAARQRPRKVIACELNPVAHSFLKENIRLNGVEGTVEPVLGDNRELPGESVADRVIMGYVKTTHEFLPAAVRLVKDGGIVHYHETCPNELLDTRPTKHLAEGARGCRVVVESTRLVKSYAPGVSHVVLDARIFKSS
jgi:tRNA wybutosine-synthesizing protein 2